MIVAQASAIRASWISFVQGLGIRTLIALGLVSTTLHSIYTAALYRFATGSKENAGIDGDLLAGAYRRK